MIDCYDFYLLSVGLRQFSVRSMPRWFPLTSNEWIDNEY